MLAPDFLPRSNIFTPGGVGVVGREQRWYHLLWVVARYRTGANDVTAISIFCSADVVAV